MSENKIQAQDALFAEICRIAQSDELKEHYVPKQAEILVDLALAYRYAAGGAQPGAAGGSSD